MNDLFSFLVLIKMGTAIAVVVLLSFLAEVMSPRAAGILSGYPLGAAISLFFMGYEIGPHFAAESALYTSIGLIATQVFAYGYYRASLLTGGMGRGLQVLCSALGGMCGYFLAAALLSPLRVNLVLATLLPTFSILLFAHLFRHVRNVRIHERADMNLKVLMLRSLFAGSAIVLITSTARAIGPAWAGLFAAFPITMLPLLVIIHFTYDPEHVHAILKHVPKGLGALVVYAMTVSMAYPVYGVALGTALAYSLATLYLVVGQVKLSRVLGR